MNRAPRPGSFTVERTLTGRLGAAYPAGRHDVELRVDDVAPAQLADVLAAASERVLRADPDCRKVVFAAPPGDLAIRSAAEQAGFRYVVDVDIPGDVQLSLLVREPEHVTHVDIDLDWPPRA